MKDKRIKDKKIKKERIKDIKDIIKLVLFWVFGIIIFYFLKNN